MNEWVRNNKAAFERDVLRDFCQAADQMFQQFGRVESTETVSFPVLRALVGEPWNKGLLWRLKDKAHHLFLPEGNGEPVSVLLDWTLGYIFHESLKLMEDAHQRQYYAPRLVEIAAEPLIPELAAMAEALQSVQQGTRESMRREANRLLALLRLSRRLFCLYFKECSRHRYLARFLSENEDLVRRVFQEEYDSFISAVYGNEPERLHLEAAFSLLESAREQAARKALDRVLSLNPHNPEALDLFKAKGW